MSSIIPQLYSVKLEYDFYNAEYEITKDEFINDSTKWIGYHIQGQSDLPILNDIDDTIISINVNDSNFIEIITDRCKYISWSKLIYYYRIKEFTIHHGMLSIILDNNDKDNMISFISVNPAIDSKVVYGSFIPDYVSTSPVEYSISSKIKQIINKIKSLFNRRGK